MSFFKRLFSKKKKEVPKEPVKKKPVQKTLTPDKDGMISKEAVIEKFTAPDKIQEGEILKIQINGYFTSAGWEIKKTSAKQENNLIKLSVIGQMEAGLMAAHVLKRYKTTIEVSGLKKGSYKIIAEKGTEEQLKIIVE